MNVEVVMDKEQIQKDIDWVDSLIQKLLRTKDLRDCRNSLWILEKRRKSLVDKLTNNIYID
jgi:hypothetical protein